MIKSNLNPVSGNVTWTIPNTVPYATYMLRAFVYRNVTQASGMNISQPLATGVSVGYFQVRAPFRHLASLPRQYVGCEPNATLCASPALAAEPAVALSWAWTLRASAFRSSDLALPYFLSAASASPISSSVIWGQHRIRQYPASRSCCRHLLTSEVRAAQINKIDDRPKGMKIAAGVCACIGPLMFLGYFLVDGLIKKNK